MNNIIMEIQDLLEGNMRLLKDKRIYIFGAGQRGIQLFSILEGYGINIVAFIDNNEKKQKELICGKKCIQLEQVLNDDSKVVILISPKQHEEIILQMESMNIKNYIDGEKIFHMYHFTPITMAEDDFKSAVPFNHYESPYPNLKEIHKKEKEIFNPHKKVLDIDFNVTRQLYLAKLMSDIDLIPWSDNPCQQYRYYYNNEWFPKGSADVLYYMMRILSPQKIIEVGSGFSTAVMLDTNNIFFNNEIEIASIEPNAERLKSLIKDNDNLKIHTCDLQDVPLDFFNQLKENDILFIDSSHVSKINSDVNYYLFEIFPRLSKGVYIHFHDVFYPFIYPKKWIYAGSAYNEMYMLRAFLMNNDKYSVQFFGEMLQVEYSDKLSSKLQSISGSLWIKKEC